VFTQLFKVVFWLSFLVSNVAQATYFDTFHQNLQRYQEQVQAQQADWTPEQGYTLNHSYQVIEAELKQLISVYSKDERLANTESIQQLTVAEESAFENLKQSMTFMLAEPLDVAAEMEGFHKSVVALLEGENVPATVLFGFVPLLEKDKVTVNIYGLGFSGDYQFDGFSVSETLRVDGVDKMSVVVDRRLVGSVSEQNNNCKPAEQTMVALKNNATGWVKKQALLGTSQVYRLTARYVGQAGGGAKKRQTFNYSSKPATAQCGQSKTVKFRFLLPHPNVSALEYSADWLNLPESAEYSAKTKKLRKSIVVDGVMSAGESSASCPVTGVLKLTGQYEYSLPVSAKVTELFATRGANVGDHIAFEVEKNPLHPEATLNLLRLKLYRTGCSKTLDNLTIPMTPGLRKSKHGRFKVKLKGQTVTIDILK